MPLDRRETQDWLRPGGPTSLRPNPTPHYMTRLSQCTSNHKRCFSNDERWDLRKIHVLPIKTSINL
uniref:Uncharacterized protein n=1 Tax=Mesocestoides corti TaxID=53468 RepID=A0A5K3ET65_MESCO